MSTVDARHEANLLLDFYGPLLTEHRREMLALYLQEDLSFQEIADQEGISRQGVADQVAKARAQLTEYEQKLGLVARTRAMRAEARRALALFDRLSASLPEGEDKAALRRSLERIRDLD